MALRHVSKKIDFGRLTLKFGKILKTRKLAYLSIYKIRCSLNCYLPFLRGHVGLQLAFVGDLSLEVTS